MSLMSSFKFTQPNFSRFNTKLMQKEKLQTCLQNNFFIQRFFPPLIAKKNQFWRLQKNTIFHIFNIWNLLQAKTLKWTHTGIHLGVMRRQPKSLLCEKICFLNLFLSLTTSSTVHPNSIFRVLVINKSIYTFYQFLKIE